MTISSSKSKCNCWGVDLQILQAETREKPENFKGDFLGKPQKAFSFPVNCQKALHPIVIITANYWNNSVITCETGDEAVCQEEFFDKRKMHRLISPELRRLYWTGLSS